MPPLFWFLLSVYLLVAAGTLLEIEFTSGKDAKPDPLWVCLVALVYASAWPLPPLRKALLARCSRR
jgi:hypothetical protein